MIPLQSVPASETEFYIGTYTDGEANRGIFRGTLDSVSGIIGTVELAAACQNPSYLCLSPDRKYLYSVEESRDASARAYRRSEDGSLVFLNEQPAQGDAACHISVHPSGSVVFVANYSTGNIISYPVRSDGSLGKPASSIQFEGSGPNLKRQNRPHAHSVLCSPDGKYLYACDLGSDKVWIFHIDPASGALSPADPAYAEAPAGEGPRHIVFSADGKRAYVNNEMGLSVSVFSRDPSTGSLQLLETVSVRTHNDASREGLSTGAILLHPNQRFLYVTSRGNDLVSQFTIHPGTGQITLVNEFPAGVATPRGAAIDPDGKWLLLAGQNDDRILSVRIDPESGALSSNSSEKAIPKPVCISF